MADPVAGWLEYAQLYSGEAAAACRCQQILGTAWLARYPRPKEIGFGNGSELKKELRGLRSSMGLKAKASLPWSPQPNATLERAHQVLGDALRAFELGGKGTGPGEEDPFEEYLPNAACAARPSFHAARGHSPGELAFGRSMLLPVKAPADWEKVRQRKQKAIARSNRRENAKRIEHTYQKGDWITVKRPGIIRKLCVPKEGPFQVIKHHDNGAATFEKEPFAEGRASIRRISPCKWKNESPKD